MDLKNIAKNKITKQKIPFWVPYVIPTVFVVLIGSILSILRQGQ